MNASWVDGFALGGIACGGIVLLYSDDYWYGVAMLTLVSVRVCMALMQSVRQ